MGYLIKFADMIVIFPTVKLKATVDYQCKLRNTSQINDGQFNTNFHSFNFDRHYRWILNTKLNVIQSKMNLQNRKEESETRCF